MVNRLHDFDLQLCRYVLDNIRGHPDRPAFATYAKKQIEPPVWQYMEAFDNDDEPQPLLLSDEELNDLTLVFEDTLLEFNPPWEPSETLHRRSIDCVPEIRTELAKEYVAEWASASARFTKILEGGRVRLGDGIETVCEWVREVRRLLRAMASIELLPHPDGFFPTPTCPQPPCPPTAPSVFLNAHKDDGLWSMLADTQTMQREIRDLLTNQRTVKDWYSVEEFACLVNKSEFTCREWCRLGRIRATKKNSGRGKYQSWAVSHEELLRYQRDGLLPLVRPSSVK